MFDSQKEQWGYEKILFIDKQGVVSTLSGSNVAMQLDTNILDKLIKGQDKTLSTQIIDNTEHLLFSIPIDNVVISGREITSIAAGYRPDSFDKELTIKAFDHDLTSQKITTSGTAITRSNDGALKTGYNVFSSLEQQISGSKNDFNDFKLMINNGETGVVSLKFADDDYNIVFTPISSGEWMVITYIPNSLVNEQSGILLRMTVLLLVTITILTAALLTVIIYNNHNNRKKLEKIAYVDDVTGGNTVKKFYLMANTILKTYHKNKYAMIFTNIERFKILNEQLGQEECDRLLHNVYHSINVELGKEECMGRISADNFCVLIKYNVKEDIVERLKNWPYEKSMKKSGEASVVMPIIELGIYEIDDKSLDVSFMIDRSKLALEKSNTPVYVSDKVRYYYFDNKIRDELYRDKKIEDRMHDALKNHEFVIYIQPKYRLFTNKIDGGEALVRWFNEEGMIPPNDFIPLFEKNGL